MLITAVPDDMCKFMKLLPMYSRLHSAKNHLVAIFSLSLSLLLSHTLDFLLATHQNAGIHSPVHPANKDYSISNITSESK